MTKKMILKKFLILVITKTIKIKKMTKKENKKDMLNIVKLRWNNHLLN